MATAKVIEAVAVTAELCGRTFTPAAAAMFVSDLEGFTDDAILGALTRCRREVKGLLTVQDVISRLDDGRPGAEQAWAMIPAGEDGSVVWSEEMAEAFGAAQPLLAAGERIPARMAFKETYERLVSAARDRREPVRWSPSFGTDASGRQVAVIDAVRARRLTLEHATELLPLDLAKGMLMSLGVSKHPLLAAPSKEGRERVRAMLADLRAMTMLPAAGGESAE